MYISDQQANQKFKTTKRISLLAFFLVGFGILGTLALLRSDAASNCAVDAKLVNQCRPWIGAEAGLYPGVASDKKSQILAHETRIGRQVDVVHFYSVPGDTLGTTEKYFIDRANTYVMLNFKPVKGGGAGNTWKDADGRNATVNSNIDKMANSIKTVAPKKLFLTIYHEPENDVSPGGSTGCGNSVTYKGNMGTTTEYVAMWQNVRNRFNALGVNNVVWAYNPMSYATWNCMIKEMWPGNSLVDWVTYDAYMHDGKAVADTQIGQFYNWLTANTDSTHAYTSKPWGLNEWGSNSATPSLAYKGYDNMTAAFTANRYPKLKMYNIWDSIAAENYQTQYTSTGTLDQTEQTHYNAFVNAVFASEPATPPADTTKPSAGFLTPGNGAVVSGLVQVAASASDNVGVARVEFSVDSSVVSTDTDGGNGWGMSWDTTKASKGAHVLKVQAYDAAGNTAIVTRDVTVNNDVTPPPTEETPPLVTVTTPTGQTVVDAKASNVIPQGSAVTLDTKTVTDSATIATIDKVEFYEGTELLVSLSSEPYTLDTKLLKPGLHNIIQKTYFKDGTIREATQQIEIKGTTGSAQSNSQGGSVVPKSNSTFAQAAAGLGITLLGLGIGAVFVLVKTGLIKPAVLLGKLSHLRNHSMVTAESTSSTIQETIVIAPDQGQQDHPESK